MIDVSLQTLQDIAAELHSKHRCRIRFMHRTKLRQWAMCVDGVNDGDVMETHRDAMKLLRRNDLWWGCTVTTDLQELHYGDADVHSY